MIDYLRELSEFPRGSEAAFSEAEYDTRIANIRTEMDQAGLDALIVTSPPNLCYAAGFTTFATYMPASLFLPRTGEPAIQVSTIEVPATLLTGWLEHVVSYEWFEPQRVAEQLAGLIRDHGLGGERIGLECKLTALSVELYRDLGRLLPEMEFVDASEVVFRVRRVKSPAELNYMREAGRFTAQAQRASIEAIAPGRTDNDIARAGYDAMVREGSEYVSIQPIVAVGSRSGWVHTTFKRVAVEVGDVVFLEYGGCYHRYSAPMMRTAVLGKPSRQMMRIAHASSNTVQAVMENIKPGRTGDDVAQRSRVEFAAVEDEVFFQGAYGYSVGIGFPPTWNEGLAYIAHGVELELEPGMTFHVPITLRVPGVFGVGLSHTIVVTEEGCEVLTPPAPELELAVVPAPGAG